MAIFLFVVAILSLARVVVSVVMLRLSPIAEPAVDAAGEPLTRAEPGSLVLPILLPDGGRCSGGGAGSGDGEHPKGVPDVRGGWGHSPHGLSRDEARRLGQVGFSVGARFGRRGAGGVLPEALLHVGAGGGAVFRMEPMNGPDPGPGSG
ncbi:alcohol dehydrogenase 1 [Striga asiatica]|uniref:Alcohol dehydrogenase 1 n=1 Tax=Striga asiatica TaxID=4170 RepID=A0A5A7PY89_STRAF|nr:alcohol dehydrogenase 1 [Striga asiatica]